MQQRYIDNYINITSGASFIAENQINIRHLSKNATIFLIDAVIPGEKKAYWLQPCFEPV